MTSLRAVFVLLAAAAVLLLTTTVAMDDFGLFTTLLVLLLAGLCLIDDVPPRLLLFQAGLVVLALSTRNLLGIAVGTQALALVVSRAAVAPAALMLLALAILGVAGGSLDLAAVGAVVRPDALAAAAGTVLLVLALLLTFVVVTQSAFAKASVPLASAAFSSAGALLAVGASLTRVSAWLTDLTPQLEGGIAAASLVALAYGASRLWLAERLRSLLVGFAFAQSGLVGLALAGGVHGHRAVLLQLATSVFALAFVGLGLARQDAGEALTLRELAAASAPASARALVVTGVLAALALPPFPGFVARLSTASALLGRGRVEIFVVALALTVGLVFGCVRLLVATLEGALARRRRSWVAEAIVFTAVLAFVLALGLFPGPLFEAAGRGAAGLF